MVSPHGWFAQDDVLGKPDTGARLPTSWIRPEPWNSRCGDKFYDSGIDAGPKVVVLTRLIPNAEGTTCNTPRERIFGTDNSWIIRVRFVTSRVRSSTAGFPGFQIWPHLEQFAEESKQVLVTELLGTPDLIIGHYSDGNLVAYRLADDFGYHALRLRSRP